VDILEDRTLVLTTPARILDLIMDRIILDRTPTPEEMLTEDLTPEPTTRAHPTTDRQLAVLPTTVDLTLDPTTADHKLDLPTTADHKLDLPTTADRKLDPTTTAQLTPVRITADTTRAPEVGVDQRTLDLTTQDRTLAPA